MRHLTTFLIALCLLSVPAAGLAQAPAELEQLNVSFWPEYDRRAVLVIYQARLAERVELPTEVSFPIPAGAGAPHAVAHATETGELFDARYELTEQGAWTLVTVQAQTRTVWLEYYLDLSIRDQDRQFTFEWPGGLAVERFTLEVQRPPGSADFQISPATAGERTDGRGLTYLTEDLGALEAGEGVRIEVSYTRNTQELTADLQEGAAPPAEPQGRESGSEFPWVTYAAAAVGVILLLGGAYLLWRRPRAAPARSRRRAAPRDKPEAEPVFCHHCGLKTRPGDRFCRRCGTKLRSPD